MYLIAEDLPSVGSRDVVSRLQYRCCNVGGVVVVVVSPGGVVGDGSTVAVVVVVAALWWWGGMRDMVVVRRSLPWRRGRGGGDWPFFVVCSLFL